LSWDHEHLEANEVVVGLSRWIAACALLLTSCGTSSPLAAHGTTPTAAPPPPPPTPPTVHLLGDGTYTIGVDITPGTWHTDGPRTERAYGVVQATSRCTWRLGWPEVKDGVPTMEEINRGEDPGPADVVLGPAGATFETKGCKAWQQR
jgi:hypothetical protein